MPYSVALRERDQLLHGARMDNRVGVEQEQVLARSRIRCSVDSRTKADVLQCEHTRLGKLRANHLHCPIARGIVEHDQFERDAPSGVEQRGEAPAASSLHSYVTTTTESLGLTAVLDRLRFAGSAIRREPVDGHDPTDGRHVALLEIGSCGPESQERSALLGSPAEHHGAGV